MTQAPHCADTLQAWPPSQPDEQTLYYACLYGQHVKDLSLDLSSSHSPKTTTDLLQNCLLNSDLMPCTTQEIWSWSVKKRLQGLLAIGVASFGEHLNLVAQCTHKTCREKLEFKLNLKNFADIDFPEHIQCHISDTTEIKLRLPNGNDQRQWSEMAFSNTDNIFQKMASTLILDLKSTAPEKSETIADASPATWPDSWPESWPDSWLEAISNALDQHDQLTSLELSLSCPECDNHFQLEIDLESHIINELKKIRQKLLEQIHLIASSYHWTEEQIVQLPPQRRQYYVNKILDDEVFA